MEYRTDLDIHAHSFTDERDPKNILLSSTDDKKLVACKTPHPFPFGGEYFLVMEFVIMTSGITHYWWCNRSYNLEYSDVLKLAELIENEA